ncbi:MAG: tetratricopeptide repeat protein [Candidatus Methylumidiphilus sp.]
MKPLDQAAALFSGGQYAAALACAQAHLPPLLQLAADAATAQNMPEADGLCLAAVAVQPTGAPLAGLDQLAELCKRLGRNAEAQAAYRAGLRLCPGRAEAHNNLGALLAESQRFAEAEACCRQALALRPQFAEAHNNLGVLLSQTERLDEAEQAFRQAIAAQPGYLPARFNLAKLHKHLRRHADAELGYRQILAIHPNHADARLNLALLLLSLGRFREGWPLYEARHDPDKAGRTVVLPNLPCPQWRGEPLAGKSVLVWPEQGYGDEIQFCRLAPLLKAQGAARVGWVCKSALAPLLASLAGLDALYAGPAGVDAGAYDYWSLPLSLPAYCGLELDNLPAALPYLQPPAAYVARWQARLPAGRFRVGLVWKGNGENANDAHRSLPSLATLAPLWQVPGVVFISLQKGAGEAEANRPPPGLTLAAVGGEIEDFADTAAIIGQLDLLISVDAAAAHVAGALGRPCWLLLPDFETDWRWLHGREDSPWYPQALRLFRRGAAESWEDVAARVAAALRCVACP